MELDRIRELVAEQFGIDADTVTAATSFEEDLNADSLDIVELVMAIEEEYDVEIEDESLEGIKTVGDVANQLKKLL